MTLKNRVLKKSLTGHGEEDDILDVTERPNVIRPLGAVLGRYLPRREGNFLFLLGGNSFFEPEGRGFESLPACHSLLISFVALSAQQVPVGECPGPGSVRARFFKKELFWFAYWEELRRHERFSVAAASRTLRTTVRALSRR